MGQSVDEEQEQYLVQAWRLRFCQGGIIILNPNNDHNSKGYPLKTPAAPLDMQKITMPQQIPPRRQ